MKGECHSVLTFNGSRKPSTEFCQNCPPKKCVMTEKDSHTFKVVFCGNTGVGKTSIIQQHCFGRFDRQARPTVGTEFVTSSVDVAGEEITMHLWDTAGQERYYAIGRIYFQGAAAAFVVYDVSGDDPLPQLTEWIDKIRSVEKNIAIIVLGNKTDLVDTVDESVSSWCHAQRCAHFLCSARTGDGIKKAFKHTAHALREYAERNPSPSAVIKEASETARVRCC